MAEPYSRLEKLRLRILAGKLLGQTYYDVRFRSYSDWSVFLKKSDRTRELTNEDIVRAAYLCAVVRRISRVFGDRVTCIVKTVAAKKVLAIQGIESDVILGVPKAGVIHEDGWQAHAWLVVGGRVMIGGPESRLYKSL